MYDDFSPLDEILDCNAASALSGLRVASVVAVGVGHVRLHVSDGCLLKVIDLRKRFESGQQWLMEVLGKTMRRTDACCMHLKRDIVGGCARLQPGFPDLVRCMQILSPHYHCKRLRSVGIGLSRRIAQ